MEGEQTQVAGTETKTGNEGAAAAASTEVKTGTEAGTGAAAEGAAASDQGVNFDFNIGDAPKSNETTEPSKDSTNQSDWRKVLKGVDKKEVLKELGETEEEYDEFDKEFARFRKQGGDPLKYIEAKFKDWNKISDQNLVFDDLKSQYPNLDDEEIKELMADKYKQDELATDDEKRRGNIALKADGYKIRQDRINEQKKFSIPENKSTNPEEVAKQQQKEEMELVEQVRQSVLKHPSIVSLMGSKKVTVPAGEFGSFNLSVSNPDEVVGYFNDAKVYNKYAYNEQGQPDMDRKVKLAMIDIIGIDKYNESLIKFGKQLATKAIIEENQNAGRPGNNSTPPSSEAPIKWRSTGGNVSPN